MTRFQIVFGIIGGIVLATGVQAQIVVVSQPNENPDGLYADGIVGQYADTRTADNFVIEDDMFRRVTRVIWWGCSDLDYVEPYTFPAWVVQFYRDDLGLPGETIHTATIPTEDVTFLATGNYNMYGAAEYEQSATLPVPQSFWKDTTYWVSIGAIVTDPDWDAWIWSLNYSAGDGICAQDVSQQGYQVVYNDLAFVLIAETAGDDCPRPGAMGKYCSGDIAGDNCVVNLNDLAALLSSYGRCPGDPLYNPAANISPNGNPCIDLSDLAELLSQYGDDCR